MAYPSYSQEENSKTRGDSIVEMMVRVFVMAAFVLFITPVVIAPLLGLTPATYAANEILWTLGSMVMGYIIGWPVAKLISKSIRGSGRR